MGRGRVQLKRIENKVNRQVTFSKRRSGLLKKANEISVLCDVQVAVIIFSANGKLYEYATDSCMQKILERYERYRYAERALVSPELEPQRNWHEEYAKLQVKVEALLKSQRHLRGEQLESLDAKELQQLEHHLETSLKQIRARKTNQMLNSLGKLQSMVNSLQEQKRVIEKEIMERSKVKAAAFVNNSGSIKSRNKNSSSSPSLLIPNSNLTLGVRYQVNGSIESEAAQAVEQTRSNMLPPWMLSHVNG